MTFPCEGAASRFWIATSWKLSWNALITLLLLVGERTSAPMVTDGLPSTKDQDTFCLDDAFLARVQWLEHWFVVFEYSPTMLPLRNPARSPSVGSLLILNATVLVNCPKASSLLPSHP
ncbi:hypothetical protein TNCV_241031 [Trichonephila clavipes]|nr:hypothetical protein TNCV_241031 [Trichonephila clavipes]